MKKKDFIDDTMIDMYCETCHKKMISIGKPSGKRWPEKLMGGIIFTCEKCDCMVVVKPRGRSDS